MINKKINYWKKTTTLVKLKKSLKNDKISISSTDTILGFLASLTLSSYQKLNELKGGRQDKPYLILIASPVKLTYFIQIENITTHITHLLAACWPGPVTLIFKANPTLPAFLSSGSGTIALRCPNHTGLQNLLVDFEGLFSTSANKSGKPAPNNPEEIEHDILEKIEYIILDGEKQQPSLLPSTILDLTSPDGTVRVVREGSYPVSTLEKIYGTPFKK